MSFVVGVVHVLVHFQRVVGAGNVVRPVVVVGSVDVVNEDAFPLVDALHRTGE